MTDAHMVAGTIRSTRYTRFSRERSGRGLPKTSYTPNIDSRISEPIECEIVGKLSKISPPATPPGQGRHPLHLRELGFVPCLGTDGGTQSALFRKALVITEAICDLLVNALGVPGVLRK